MKLKHTQAKKARRSSSFRSMGTYASSSEKRRLLRETRQPKKPKTFGLQVVRTQRIFLKIDRFGAPVFRTIKHTAAE